MAPKPDAYIVKPYHNAAGVQVFGVYLRSVLVEAGLEDHTALFSAQREPKPYVDFATQEEADQWVAAVRRDKS